MEKSNAQCLHEWFQCQKMLNLEAIRTRHRYIYVIWLFTMPLFRLKKHSWVLEKALLKTILSAMGLRNNGIRELKKFNKNVKMVTQKYQRLEKALFPIVYVSVIKCYGLKLLQNIVLSKSLRCQFSFLKSNGNIALNDFGMKSQYH